MSERREITTLSSVEPKNKEKKEQPERSKIIKGSVKAKKEGPIRSLFRIFFSGDPKEVFKNVFTEIFVPDILDAISNATKGGIDGMIYGDMAKRPTGDREYYSSISSKQRGRRTVTLEQKDEKHPKLVDLAYKNKSDAENVLFQLKCDIDEYDEVSVAAVYDYSGLVPYSTDSNFGWYDLSEARIYRTPYGDYIIKYPRPTRI